MKDSIRRKVYQAIPGFAMLFSFLFILTACSDSDDDDNNVAEKGPNDVYIVDMAFVPNTITVAAGTTITWTNKDGTAHTVTSATGLFDSGAIATGKTFTFTFNEAGSFSYYCSIHPVMIATVTVD